MRKRKLYSYGVAVALLVALGVLLVMRFHAPPEVARLLPESDAILYANVKGIRATTHFTESPAAPAPEYARFVAATGFQWDRDLDRVAISLHRMADPHGPNGVVAYTGVLEGRFDAERLTHYLQANSSAREVYDGHDVYTLPESEGRILRVTLLGYDMVAASNVPVPEQIHSVIDRYSAGASPFSGSSLLDARFREIPLFAFAWGIGHIGLPFSDNGNIQVFGVALPLPEDTDFVASLAWRGSVQLRIDEIAPSSQDASQTLSHLGLIIGILKGFTEPGGSPQDQALHEAFQSLTVEQKGDRVVLRARLSPTLLQPAH